MTTPSNVVPRPTYHDMHQGIRMLHLVCMQQAAQISKLPVSNQQHPHLLSKSLHGAVHMLWRIFLFLISAARPGLGPVHAAPH
jgi:hypothetical protein